MIKKVVTFGDSFMYGTELPYDDPDVKPIVDKMTKGLRFDDTGSVRHEDITAHLLEAQINMEQSIPDYDERCNQYCMTGYLARKLRVPSFNYSYGGYSNDAIMSEIIMHRHELDQDTLVIVDLTFPSRNTQLRAKTLHGKIKSINNYHTKTSEQAEYLRLDDQFGDDLLVKYIHVRNHISSIRETLRGIPHIILDPMNTYRESPELNMKVFGWDHDKCIISAVKHELIRPMIAHALQDYFNASIFQYTFNHAMASLRQQGVRYRQPFGHPNRTVHEIFVDTYVMPWLIENGFVR